MVSRTWEFCGKIDEFITNHIFYNFEAFNKNKALFCARKGVQLTAHLQTRIST